MRQQPDAITGWNKLIRALVVAERAFEEFQQGARLVDGIPGDIRADEQQRLDIFSAPSFSNSLPMLIPYWQTNGGLKAMIIQKPNYQEGAQHGRRTPGEAGRRSV